MDITTLMTQLQYEIYNLKLKAFDAELAYKTCLEDYKKLKKNYEEVKDKLDAYENWTDLEKISSKVHYDWIQSKLKAGIVSRLSETGEELINPYEKLSEQAKELDRNTVRTVLKAIQE